MQCAITLAHKSIFDVNKLDLAKVAKAFGFAVPPRVDISIGRDGEADISKALKRTRDEFASDDDEEEKQLNESIRVRPLFPSGGLAL